MRTRLVVLYLLAWATVGVPAEPPRIRIALAGDSTVTAKAGWGDGFTACLSDRTEVVNLSAGGRSTRSFDAEGRWKKCLEQKADYILIQFGHNDQKRDIPKVGTDPETTYRQFLTQFIDDARKAGAKPILVTSLSRREWGSEGKIRSTLVAYVEAARAVAKEKNVPLVDLHARSIELYERLGRAGVEKLSPRKGTEIDHSHLNAQGSETVGRIVAEEFARVVPEFAVYVKGAMPSVEKPK